MDTKRILRRVSLALALSAAACGGSTEPSRGTLSGTFAVTTFTLNLYGFPYIEIDSLLPGSYLCLNLTPDTKVRGGGLMTAEIPRMMPAYDGEPEEQLDTIPFFARETARDVYDTLFLDGNYRLRGDTVVQFSFFPDSGRGLWLEEFDDWKLAPDRRSFSYREEAGDEYFEIIFTAGNARCPEGSNGSASYGVASSPIMRRAIALSRNRIRSR